MGMHSSNLCQMFFLQSRKGFNLFQSECSRNDQVWFCLPYATHKFGFVWVHRKHLHWNKAGLRGHHHEPCRQAMPWSGMVLSKCWDISTATFLTYSSIGLLIWCCFHLVHSVSRYQNISGGDISQVHLDSGVHGAVATQSRPGNSGIPGMSKTPRSWNSDIWEFTSHKWVSLRSGAPKTPRSVNESIRIFHLRMVIWGVYTVIIRYTLHVSDRDGKTADQKKNLFFDT